MGTSAQLGRAILGHFASLRILSAPHPGSAIVVRKGTPARTTLPTFFFFFFFFGLEEAKWQRGSANARFPKYLTRSGSSPPSRGKPSRLSQRLLHGSTGIFSCRQLKAAIWWQSPRLKFAGEGFSLLPPRRSRGSRSWRPQLPSPHRCPASPGLPQGSPLAPSHPRCPRAAGSRGRLGFRKLYLRLTLLRGADTVTDELSGPNRAQTSGPENISSFKAELQEVKYSLPPKPFCALG